MKNDTQLTEAEYCAKWGCIGYSQSEIASNL